MPPSIPTRLLLSLSVAASLSACQTPAPDPAPTAAMEDFRLDEGQLPPFIQFNVSDLDTTIDACSAFGDHVNGKWMAAASIPADRSSWGMEDVLEKRSKGVQIQILDALAVLAEPSHVEKILGDLWATGLDEAQLEAQGLTPLAEALDAIAALDNRDALVHYLHETAARGQNRLFSFSVSADYKDSGTNIAYAYPRGLGLPDAGLYADPSKANLIDDYRTHVAAMLALSGMSAEESARQAAQVLALETRLAAVSTPTAALAADHTLEYNPVSIAQADAIAPHFRWHGFFATHGLPEPKMFSLSMPGFHKEVSDAIDDTPLGIWRAYLRFHEVRAAAPRLSEAFAREHFEFNQKRLRGVVAPPPRRERVLNDLYWLAGDAIAQRYVAATFPAETKARIESMVTHLKNALRSRIKAASWMGEQTRTSALAKLDAMTVKIGHPDKWENWDGLHTDRTSYLANVRNAVAFRYRTQIARMGTPVDRDEWMIHPQSPGAYYLPNNNEIAFTAAFLQPPQFDAAADDALNYGGIGAIIGHELIHGFDINGSQFGPRGELENWWAADDAKRFTALSNRLKAQISQYRVEGKPVDSTLILGESMADLGGLAVAFDALQAATAGTTDPMIDGFSREQRFFYGNATVYRSKVTAEQSDLNLRTNPHPPYSIRAFAAASNHPGFAAAFQCKPGTPMARPPEDRVVIW
ncbi:M13 family metallopeptidase [Stenotrophomonas sepilia]|uniref:M13 family metallopeptidase n=1 Tax=Stenotrophomonas sepilia TaxID=2860290 RepID=UPI00334243D9